MALTETVARDRGETTLMADDFDVSSLAATIIFQALRPVVHEHHDIEPSGASLDELAIDDGDAAVDTAVEEGGATVPALFTSCEHHCYSSCTDGAPVPVSFRTTK